MSYQSVLGLRLRATPVSSPSFLPKQQQQQQQQQQSQARRRSQPANGGGDGKLREVGGNSFFPSLYNMPAHCPQSEISILRTMHKFCDKDFFKRNLLYKNSSLGCWITKTIKKNSRFWFPSSEWATPRDERGKIFCSTYTVQYYSVRSSRARFKNIFVRSDDMIDYTHYLHTLAGPHIQRREIITACTSTVKNGLNSFVSRRHQTQQCCSCRGKKYVSITTTVLSKQL